MTELELNCLHSQNEHVSHVQVAEAQEGSQSAAHVPNVEGVGQREEGEISSKVGGGETRVQTGAARVHPGTQYTSHFLCMSSMVFTSLNFFQLFLLFLMVVSF